MVSLLWFVFMILATDCDYDYEYCLCIHAIYVFSQCFWCLVLRPRESAFWVQAEMQCMLREFRPRSSVLRHEVTGLWSTIL